MTQTKNASQNRWLDTLSLDHQQEMLARHKAFWRREPGSKPLVGFAPKSHMFPLQNIDIRHEGRFSAADLSDEMIAADTRYRPEYHAEDDLFPAKIPMEPMAWSEGYTGAEVFVSARAGTVWAEPSRPVPKTLEELKARLQTSWLEKMAAATRANVVAAGSEILIAESLFRGPADCLESLIGGEQLCLWLYDRPALLAEMADWLADRVAELQRAQFENTPSFHGGTINRYRLWGPGKNIVTQADIANVMSPKHFRDIFVPSYRTLIGGFDTATIHFHSSARQHMTALLEIEELAAVEWAMDPTGPTLEEMIPVFVQILETKCVILMNIKPHEVSLLLNNLPHEGLCIIVRR